MRAKVLKPFPYAHDGITIRNLAEGDLFDCQPGVFEGLKSEGYIEETDEEAKLPVEIPATWADLSDEDKLALATAIAGKRVKKPESAVAVIEAELAHRGDAQQ